MTTATNQRRASVLRELAERGGASVRNFSVRKISVPRKIFARRGIFIKLLPATILFSLPALALAQQPESPVSYVQSFYNFALAIGGILAFGAIVYGGVIYTFAAGNPSKQDEGKKWIWGALLGLLLLAGAYLVLYTINPKLVELSLTGLPGLPPGGGGGTGQDIKLTNCTSKAPSYETGYANTSGMVSPGVAAIESCVRNNSKFSGIGNITTWQGEHTCNAVSGSSNYGSESCHFGGKFCGDGSHAIDFGKNGLPAGATLKDVYDYASNKNGQCGPHSVQCFYEIGDYRLPDQSNPGNADHVHCNVDTDGTNEPQGCGCK